MTDTPPHQERAVDEIMSRSHLLVEYGTGTGKTRIYVDAIVNMVEVGDVPILLTVPNSLIEQTLEEFQRWAGKEWTDQNVTVLAPPLTLAQRRDRLKERDSYVYIISHESLSFPMVKEGLRFKRWAASIVDEASRFRRYSTRTRTLQALGSVSDTRYAFTGNLVPQAPTDAFYVMNFLDPGCFGTRNIDTFRTEYCLLGGFTGTKAIGVRPDKLAKLREIMDEHRIKVELKDIRDMPERTLSVYRTTMEPYQRDAYVQMQEELLVQIERETEDTFRSQASTYATRLQRLQEIAAGFSRNIEGDVVRFASPKTRELAEILASTPDIPTVVWYWWNPERDVIQETLAKAGIPFATFESKNDTARQRFMDGDVSVFVSQIAKGGYGLNLTRAERMIYHSLPWSVDVYTQSQERNMRLTTTADHLEVVHLVVRNSVDEYVRKCLIEKADVSKQLSRSTALELLTRKP